MRLTEYLKDRAGIFLLHIGGLLFLSFFLKLSGNTNTDIILVVFIWVLAAIIYFGTDFYCRRKYFRQLFLQLEKMDRRYLISEVMEPSWRLEDRLYREVLRKSNKSVIEKIHELEDAGREYKEYIEQWIHETKLPLTAARLICENRPSEESRMLLLELGKIERQVEQALFYARMEHAYQDYIIYPINLRETVLTAIAQNKPYFISCGMQISLELSEEEIVSGDEKWVVFLLNQIFSNCMKYRRESAPQIHIYTQRGKQRCSLIIEDNGIGIAPEDCKRIFDKGFTGKNGRMEGRGTETKSTGIGLYLCKRLCDKLGIGIICESEQQKFTKLILTFPDSDFSKLSKM